MNDVQALVCLLSDKPWKKELSMTVNVRRIEHSEHEYFAYTKSLCGKATYFLYFTDDIWGAIVLNNFVEMLRRFFEKEEVRISFTDTTVQPKNEYLLTILREECAQR
jgi:hypothetical protein